MISPLHDKGGFFKYYTAESAKLTLKSATRKWSTPLLFNDPFDNQFDLYFEEPSKDLAEKTLEKFHRTLNSPEPFKANQFGAKTPAMELLRQVHVKNPDLKYTEEETAYLLEGVMEGMQRTIDTLPQANDEIRRIMADTTVFCLSETHDNLLMWSHYAQNHTGAVVNFLSLSEVDSPLILAQPVRYSAQMPRLAFNSLMDFDEARKAVYEIITLTKTEVWAYEKEWRIITTLRNKTQSYEILPYAPEEVAAIYLGCKMTKDDREEIVDVTRSKYPRAKVLQAEKHEKEFALIFRDIA
jgi:hypothetical protein